MPTVNDHLYINVGYITARANDYKRIDKEAKKRGADYYYVGPSYARINQVGWSKVVDYNSKRADIYFYKMLTMDELQRRNPEAAEQIKRHNEELDSLQKILDTYLKSEDSLQVAMEAKKYERIEHLFWRNDSLIGEVSDGNNYEIGRFLYSQDTVLHGPFKFYMRDSLDNHTKYLVYGYYQQGELMAAHKHRFYGGKSFSSSGNPAKLISLTELSSEKGERLIEEELNIDGIKTTLYWRYYMVASKGQELGKFDEDLFLIDQKKIERNQEGNMHSLEINAGSLKVYLEFYPSTNLRSISFSEFGENCNNEIMYEDDEKISVKRNIGHTYCLDADKVDFNKIKLESANIKLIFGNYFNHLVN